VPPFEDIRDQVEGEWRRQLGDRSLRQYLAVLREDADIVTRPQFDQNRGEN